MVDLKEYLSGNSFEKAQELYQNLQSKNFCVRYPNPVKLANAFSQVTDLLEKAGKNLQDLGTNDADFAKLRCDMIAYKKVIIARSKKQPLL